MAAAEEEGTAAEAEVAQAAAGKAEAGIAMAEVEDQARLAVADLTMTRWTLTSRVLLAGTHSATNLCHVAAGLATWKAEPYAAKKQPCQCVLNGMNC